MQQWNQTRETTNSLMIMITMTKIKKKIDTSSNNEDKNENKSNIDLENQENVNKNTYIDFDDDYKQIEGICCYCGYECNILSQSCGKCAREYTMRMFNWK